MLKNIFRILVLAIVLGCVSLWFGYQHVQQQWQQSRDTQVEVLSVAAGDNFNRVLSKAYAESPAGEFWLRVWTKLNPDDAVVKTGYYALDQQLSLAELSAILRRGEEIQLEISLIEGETFKQFWEKLNQSDGIVASEKSEAELLAQLGSPFEKMEGLLLPETYFYTYNTSSEAVVQRAYASMQQVLNKHWEARAEGLPIDNAYEALILASIIEKETGAKFERPRIASVFVNRLNRRMRLQTDPTVIYGMGDRYDGRIRTRDLRESTPYNTYVIRALPPTPIAMPSEHAIEAALNPEDSNYLYFVAKGAGEHYFSKSYREHKAAVDKYILKK